VRDLIVSDIHANWEALEAVLACAAGRYDRIVCCGDLIGYGPDPNRVVDWARTSVEIVIRGNHDKAAVSPETLEWFNPIARSAAEWTLGELTPENLEFIRRLPRGPLPVDSYQIAHGSPLDEDEYLTGEIEAGQAFEYAEREITFFGHTHLQGGFALSHRRVVPLAGPARPHCERTLDLDPDTAYLINPGAVGQPRDGDSRAAYALYEPGSHAVTYCREPYDIKRVQEKIRRAGLADMLAERLAVGR
jgi:predicted phosphodiesterase